MINHKVYIRYSDLFDHKPAIQTLKKVLRRLKFSNAALQLAQMNALLALSRYDTESFRAVQGLLMANFLDDEIYEDRLKSRFGKAKTDERPVFFRQQVLAMLRLCTLECSEDAPLIAEGKTPGGYALGRCCMILSDHLLSSRQEGAISTGSPTRKRKHLALQMAPTFDLSNPPHLPRTMVRSDVMFTDLLHSEQMRGIIQGPLKGFNLEAEFHSATSLTLEQYRDLVFATLIWYESQEQAALMSNPGVLQIHRSKYIAKSHITQEQFDRYLALDSIKLASLPEKVWEHRDKMNEEKESVPPVLPQYDFAIFRRWPLLELHNGNLICLDPSFLIEKLGIGFHWTILNSLPDKRKRERALQSFGYLFELYVDRLMRTMYPAESNVFLSFPRFCNGEESFDGVVCLGDHLIVMEYKGGALTQAAKYGGRLKYFESDLDREKKFGVGRGAGVYQLAAKIERLFHRDRSHRESIPKLSAYLNRIVKVTPILIVQEPFLRFDFMNWMLNNRFQNLIGQKQVSRAIEVAPLQLIDVDSLEQIKVGVQAGAFRFDQCINWRAFDDPDLLSSFATYPWSHFFPGFKGLSDPEVEERFDAIIERIKRNFFGE